MPRLYGPGHFTEDPYSQVVSPHGIPVDDLVAVLQKEIRRSRIDNAVLAAYEMFTTSADVAQHLWRRLRLIAVEDVGMGLPLGPVLIDVLHRNFNAKRARVSGRSIARSSELILWQGWIGPASPSVTTQGQVQPAFRSRRQHGPWVNCPPPW